MNKNFKFYLGIWSTLLVVFNVIAFVSPGWIFFEKYTPSFWIGYIFIMLSFVGQLACAFKAFNVENSQKLFYNVSILKISFTGLILTFVFGGLCMLLSFVPYWVAAIVCVIISGVVAISIFKATGAIDIVSEVDTRIKNKTYFIKSLTVDTEHVMETAKTDELKAIAKKVYEVVRFSDPMSNVALVEIEEKIESSFCDFSAAIESQDFELASSNADELLSLINIRNKKCKLLK